MSIATVPSKRAASHQAAALHLGSIASDVRAFGPTRTYSQVDARAGGIITTDTTALAGAGVSNRLTVARTRRQPAFRNRGSARPRQDAIGEVEPAAANQQRATRSTRCCRPLCREY